MPENYVFAGGAEECNGMSFNANMPTEEIFSAPDCRHVDGKIVAAMPLCYNGKIIEGLELTLKDGVIVDYTAKKNLDILKGIIETDEGSKRLGEIALVPYDSPISKLHTLFYETLFDENASCHFVASPRPGRRRARVTIPWMMFPVVSRTSSKSSGYALLQSD